MDNPILTVAFIVMITSFFKKQLALTGWKVLLAAFVVALVVGLVPVAIAAFPTIASWLAAILNVIVLFLTAAGSMDFIIAVRTTTKPPEPGIK
jgi:hypothetical protein